MLPGAGKWDASLDRGNACAMPLCILLIVISEHLQQHLLFHHNSAPQEFSCLHTAHAE
jgi:hypothetical protein